MTHIIELHSNHQEEKLISENGFKSLFLKSASLQGVDMSDEMASIQFVLISDTHMFNAYANQIPGTMNLNCFDLLLAASNNPNLRDHHFHTLKCLLNNDKAGISVRLEISAESF